MSASVKVREQKELKRLKENRESRDRARSDMASSPTTDNKSSNLMQKLI